MHDGIEFRVLAPKAKPHASRKGPSPEEGARSQPQTHYTQGQGGGVSPSGKADPSSALQNSGVLIHRAASMPHRPAWQKIA
jgi:hypothetical protein